MKQTVLASLLLVAFLSGNSQKRDTIPQIDSATIRIAAIKSALMEMQSEKTRIRSLIVPSLMITYGIVAVESEPLRSIDYSTKEEIREDHPHFHTNVDNYLQYAPAFTVYALNLVGIKGKNNFRDRTMIFILASAIAGTTVQSLKAITKSPRPNGDSRSFPSGHTATAFTGAEFLRQEYKEVSPFYGIVGYLMATGTGILRVCNNAHWVRDVLPGAGIGILSTRIAYWVYPTIEKRLFPHSSAVAMVMPEYEGGGWGASMMFAINL